MSASPPPQRLRVMFGKRGPLIYIGHLDTARTWERVLRRAGLPLAYSHGFNPRPRLQLADALPLGVSSDCELMDVWLKTPALVEGLAARLGAVAPGGLVVHSVVEVELKGPALQTLVAAADYLIAFPEGGAALDLDARVRRFLACERVERTRRGKAYDLRPLVHRLAATADGSLEATLSLGDAGTARPDELLEALGLSGTLATVHRQRLYLRHSLEGAGEPPPFARPPGEARSA